MKCLIYFSALYVLLATGCDSKISSSQSEPPQQKKAIASIQDVAPEKMRDFLAEAYRLQPDKRFLMAVAEVHAFFSGKQRENVSTTFQDGQWEIRYRNELVGSLPELPDFKDIMALLTQWINNLDQKYPLNLASSPQPIDPEIEKLREQFLAPYAAAAAQKTDAAWKSGQRNPALLYSAARSLAFLTVQRMDRLETADILPAKALAVLAIAKTATNSNLDHEESLLAYTMGYSGHAVVVAKTLPPQDAVRLYVTREEQLKELATAPGASAEAQYLYLSNLVARGEAEPVLAWVKYHYPDYWRHLPVYKAGLDLHAFSLTPALAEAMPRLVLLSLAQEVGPLPDITELEKNSGETVYSDKELKSIVHTMNTIMSAKQGTMIDHFASALQLLDKKYSGPFLDAETYKAYYTGYFFSSLRDLGLHYLDSLSSAEAANQYAATLGKAESGIAADFQQWYRGLSQSKEGKSSLQALMNDMQGLPHLGARPLMRTFGELSRYFTYGDPTVMKAVKLLMTKLDSRIEHRSDLLNIAYADLHDLKLTQKLTNSILSTAPSEHESLQSWYGNYAGDVGMLKGLLHSEHVKLPARLRVLSYLATEKRMETKAIQKEYERLIQENPDAWGVRSKYARYLMHIKQYRKARSIVQTWQKRKVLTAGLESITAQTIVADTYYREGNYKKGWAAIKPEIESQKGDALHIAALLQDKLNRRNEAEQMAQALVDRYPDDISSRMVLVELFWKHGKYEEAAQALKAARHEILMVDWQFTIAPKFAKIFMDKPQGKTLEAFSALRAQKFNDHALLRLTFPIEKAEKYALAFAMVSQLKGTGLEHVVFLTHTYRYLKSYKGKQEALSWLRKTIPPGFVVPASMIVYDQKEYELLWELVAKPGQGNEGDYVWLARAAASLRMGAANDPHRDELVNHFSNVGDGFYNTIGKYFTDLIAEKDVLARIKTGKERCEAAYFMGLKAQSEGRYEDASDWFRVTVETGLTGNGEYRWANDTLNNWYAQGKSLSRLQSEKL